MSTDGSVQSRQDRTRILLKVIAVEFVLLPASGAVAKAFGVGFLREQPWRALALNGAALFFFGIALWRGANRNQAPPPDNDNRSNDREGNWIFVVMVLLLALPTLWNLYDLVQLFAHK